MKTLKFTTFIASALMLLCFIPDTKAQLDTSGCTPYPCFAPARDKVDSTIHYIDYSRITEYFRTGWLYKFHVEAGNVYVEYWTEQQHIY